MDDVPQHVGAFAGGLGRHLSDFSRDIARKLRQTSQRLTQHSQPASGSAGNSIQLQNERESFPFTAKTGSSVTPLEGLLGKGGGKANSGKTDTGTVAGKVSSQGANLERQKLPRIKTKPRTDRKKVVSDEQRRQRSGVRVVHAVNVSFI